MNDTERVVTPLPELPHVRDDLRRAEFTTDVLTEFVKPLGADQNLDIPIVAYRAELAEAPLNTLVKLFILGQSVPAASLDAVFSPRNRDSLRQAGLLQTDDDGAVRSIAKLMPYEDFYTIGDFGPEVTGQPYRQDHVLGVGPASLTLASLTPRPHAARALDLGTGAGIQSLLLTRHADAVLGTDTCRRALDFARFNAALNAAEGVECREGSFFDPVEHETFDLIVCNPPFVISPDSDFVFRDAGLRGDQVSEHVVRGMPSHLTPGGFGITLVNWTHATDDDWAEKPLHWVDDTGCDAWVISLDCHDVLTYAARWLHANEDETHDFATALKRWMDYYAELGAARITAGAVVMRRRTDGRRGWLRADHIPSGRHIGKCGKQIERIFDAETFLQAHESPQSLLDAVYTVAPDLRLEHHLAIENGKWTLQSETLKQTEGLSLGGSIDVHIMAMLEPCDGTRPLRTVLAPIAQRLETDVESLTPAIARITTKLLRAGLLIAPPRQA